MTKTPIYRVWNAMKQRCLLESNESYPIYGARGITVCDEWITSFEIFYAWAMTKGYAKGLQIDREDNDGNYEPNNCRWVVPAINARNRSTTKLDLIDVLEAKYMIARGYGNKVIAELLDVHQNTIWAIRSGKNWKDAAVA